MTARLARTADGWWVMTPAGLVLLDLPVATTAGLLADRAGLAEATLASSVSSDEIFRKLLTDDRIIGDDTFTTGGAA
jgi:hypothetical protein